jgi:hypothetical protein
MEAIDISRILLILVEAGALLVLSKALFIPRSKPLVASPLSLGLGLDLWSLMISLLYVTISGIVFDLRHLLDFIV